MKLSPHRLFCIAAVTTALVTPFTFALIVPRQEATSTCAECQPLHSAKTVCSSSSNATSQLYLDCIRNNVSQQQISSCINEPACASSRDKDDEKLEKATRYTSQGDQTTGVACWESESKQSDACAGRTTTTTTPTNPTTADTPIGSTSNTTTAPQYQSNPQQLNAGYTSSASILTSLETSKWQRIGLFGTTIGVLMLM